jgi:hypothetical protein
MKSFFMIFVLCAVVLAANAVFPQETESATVASVAVAAPTVAPGQSSPVWVKTEIYLGKESIPGFEISRLQFSKFMDTVVTKYFPKGFTLYETYGQMQEPDGSITKQATWVIVIVHEKTEENEKAVETVISEYRKQFMNAEVMRTVYPVEANFYTQK